MYVTWKVYFYSLIYMQLRLSNLFADRPLIKAWGLSLLNIMVSGEVKKLIRRNWSLPLVMRRQLFHWIARVIAK